MSTHHSILFSVRSISANPTLSTISTTDLSNVVGSFVQYSVKTEAKDASIPTTFNTESEQPKQTKSQSNSSLIQQTSDQTKYIMKESKQNNTEKTADKPTNQSLEKNIKSSSRCKISKLAVVSIVLTLGLGGFMFYHGHKEAEIQNATIVQLQSQLSLLKNNVTDDVKHYIDDSFVAQNTQLSDFQKMLNDQLNTAKQEQLQISDKVGDSITLFENNIAKLNERLAAISNTDNTAWLISEANYLINLAGRKIWNDQDYTTARLLLKNADINLAQANDPSLLPARKAINEDIVSLAKISFVDFDGIVLKLITLTDSINKLPLVNHYKTVDLNQNNQNEIEKIQSNEQISENDEGQLSSSLADWYQNAKINTQAFFKKFIQVEKYDDFSECVVKSNNDSSLLKKCQVKLAIIQPEQALYLRENIKLRLLLAAQAVPRHQEVIYQNALNEALIWVSAYFDGEDPETQAFIQELESLQKQSINNQNIPEQLISLHELDKLMQTRVRSMLAK